ncbi:MAG: tRNA (guanine-N(7)-)-methyltransferase non-catalytic subunit trm82 [Bathelium mastoideum]|nr:MAG: tRNA (guanine-N(7)-)-methyltransferase non-catalytic subunit trm82 [Bathelium mastoideum]
MVFHRLLACNQRGFEELGSYLLAAAGTNICTLNKACDQIVSVWPRHSQVDKLVASYPVKFSKFAVVKYVFQRSENGKDEEVPAGKRRKISNDEERPVVLDLMRTKDGAYVVATTAEDKCMRVFRLRPEGRLELLSERCMPKRPSAIALTLDDKTILVGDKFGDVYALPLHEPLPNDEDAVQSTKSQDVLAKPFKPAATELTVHSARNRRALENQLRVKEHVKTKEPLKFAHELLLGHVSMLTGLAVAVAEDKESELREYIITADRDEHIRVSRSRPQAHIIEGYCLGHKQFISKLCIFEPNRLVSAGGEDEIYVWNWMTGRLLRKLNFGTAVRKFRAVQMNASTDSKKSEDDKDLDEQIAVSGLWNYDDRLLIACEGIPALIQIGSHWINKGEDEESNDPRIHIELLPGNVLDITVMSDTIVVSIDNVHKPWSMSALQSPDNRPALLHLLKSEKNMAQDSITAMQVRSAPLELSTQISYDPKVRGGKEDNEAAELVQPDKEFWDLVYHVGNLRKRSGTGDEE